MIRALCNTSEIQAQAGFTVAQVRDVYSHALNSTPDDTALVNGRVVSEDTVLAEDDILEFLHPGVIDGFLGGRVAGKPPARSANQPAANAIDLDDDGVRDVAKEQTGLAGILEIMNEKLERLVSGLLLKNNVNEVAASDYVTIKQAAVVAALSQSYIRRAVHSGELPASNIGTPEHPMWRIARKDLDNWMKSKKGGSRIPPKSEMQDLIDRHLPGLRG